MVSKEKNQKVIVAVEKYVEKKNLNDPRKEAFLIHYFTPNSPTFSNGYQSALKAGFSPHYAKRVVYEQGVNWIKDFQREYRTKILNKAEIRLWELMHSGSDKVSADMTKFALSTLGKDTYSERKEVDNHHTVTHELDEDQVKRILENMKR